MIAHLAAQMTNLWSARQRLFRNADRRAE